MSLKQTISHENSQEIRAETNSRVSLSFRNNGITLGVASMNFPDGRFAQAASKSSCAEVELVAVELFAIAVAACYSPGGICARVPASSHYNSRTNGRWIRARPSSFINIPRREYTHVLARADALRANYAPALLPSCFVLVLRRTPFKMPARRSGQYC